MPPPPLPPSWFEWITRRSIDRYGRVLGMCLYATAHETGAVPGPPPPCPSLGHRFICMRVQSIPRLLQESLQGVRDAMDFWERWVAAGQQRLWSGATGVPPMRAAGVPPMPEPRQSPSRSRSPSHAPPRPSAPPAPEPRPSAPPSAPWDQKWLRVPPASPALLFSGLAAANDEWNRFVVSGAARDLPRYHLRKK
jgi:hypothetical protein